ncbi:MAG TPA: hypothetical protein VK163_02690 [Opitutaceae bacterium]|nr:hypothetical protein [Opitutaceae bacterium]
MSAAHALRPRPFSDAVLDRLAQLSPRAERSRSLFAAPLGPDEHGLYLPRYVAFGPNATDSDARLSLLAGFAENDDTASIAAFDLVERAVESPATIGGVVLDVVPVVNRGGGVLWSSPWVGAHRPELALLEREYRRLAPHALVQLRSGAPRAPQGAIRGDSLVHWLDNATPSLFAAIWREEPRENFVVENIDELVPDLPFRPLEIHLTLGPDPDGNTAALHAIVQRIRELLAHAQHL